MTMPARRFATVLAGVVLSLATLPALALEPFTADYQARYMGMSGNGRMSLERQGAGRWKYTLNIQAAVGSLTQVTVFEDHAGGWRPLSGTDASLLLVKKIRRNAVYDWGAGQARWSGDVKPERAGPVALQPGDMDGLLINLAVVRDAAAGKPLRYRLVDDGRAKPMVFTVTGTETVTVAGKAHQATRAVYRNGDKEMIVWVVAAYPMPVRILQRKDGKDDIDLRMTGVR